MENYLHLLYGLIIFYWLNEYVIHLYINNIPRVQPLTKRFSKYRDQEEIIEIDREPKFYDEHSQTLFQDMGNIFKRNINNFMTNNHNMFIENIHQTMMGNPEMLMENIYQNLTRDNICNIMRQNINNLMSRRFGVIPFVDEMIIIIDDDNKNITYH